MLRPMNAVTIASDVQILFAGDEGWDSARLAYNLTVDGQQVTCNRPGTPFNPNVDYFDQTPDCGYVYKRSSASYPGHVVRVTATLYYRATWSAAGAPGGGDQLLADDVEGPIEE